MSGRSPSLAQPSLSRGPSRHLSALLTAFDVDVIGFDFSCQKGAPARTLLVQRLANDSRHAVGAGIADADLIPNLGDGPLLIQLSHHIDPAIEIHFRVGQHGLAHVVEPASALITPVATQMRSVGLGSTRHRCRTALDTEHTVWPAYGSPRLGTIRCVWKKRFVCQSHGRSAPLDLLSL